MSRYSDTDRDDDDNVFTETRMTVGEHLEELRRRLIRAVLGIVVAFIVALCFGNRIVELLQVPIRNALARYDQSQKEEAEEPGEDDPPATQAAATQTRRVRLHLTPEALRRLFPAAGIDPDGEPIVVDADLDMSEAAEPAPAPTAATPKEHKLVSLDIRESFLVYIRVSFYSGLILAAPWIFIQVWGFVAAGLYSHEKRFTRTLLPMCIILFLGGVAFCFWGVFPVVLEFLLWFSTWLGVTPQFRLSDWVSFSIQLPFVFGIAFQMPLVMLLLDRSGIVRHRTLRAKRRHAVVACFVIAMLLTPPDPASQILMALPLIVLYELGLVLAGLRRDTDEENGEGDEPAPPSSSEPLAG